MKKKKGRLSRKHTGHRRRSPDSGRRTPVAGFRSPDTGRRIPVTGRRKIDGDRKIAGDAGVSLDFFEKNITGTHRILPEAYRQKNEDYYP